MSETRPLLSSTLVDLHTHDRGTTCFPALVAAEGVAGTLFDRGAADGRSGSSANLDESLWKSLHAAWGLGGDLAGPAAARLVLDLFHLCLALCHAPQYEADHKDSLAQDWAHLPIPRTRKAFDHLAALGERVAVLLDAQAKPRAVIRELLGAEVKTLGVVERLGGGPVHEADLIVEHAYYAAAPGRWVPRSSTSGEAWRACWGAATGDLFLNPNVYLRHVPERVWRHELGGYPVVKKWLGYRDSGRRPGRALTLAEVDHLREMIQRLAALLALHERLDAAYEQAIADAFTAQELGLR